MAVSKRVSDNLPGYKARKRVHDLEAEVERLRSRAFAEAVEQERASYGAGDDEYNVSAMQSAILKALDG